jgi:hypothetical protein
MMELALNQHDMHRILACLAHTATHFEDEVTRQQSLQAAMLGQPLGLLGALVSGTIAEMFNDEAQQLRTLRDRLTAATGLGLCPDTAVGSPFTIM